MTNSEGGRDDDEALKVRLDRLSRALHERKQREPTRGGMVDVSAGSTGRALSLGIRVLSEFVAGIIAGGGIGLLLDKGFSTAPLFLIVFLAVGTAAGFWNVYRIAAAPTGGRRDGAP